MKCIIITTTVLVNRCTNHIIIYRLEKKEKNQRTINQCYVYEKDIKLTKKWLTKQEKGTTKAKKLTSFDCGLINMLSTDFDQSIVGFLKTKYDLLFLLLFLFLLMRCDLLSWFSEKGEIKNRKTHTHKVGGEMHEIWTEDIVDFRILFL